jgi:molybdenum cofactor biosynthesis enzyme MoaA
MSAEEISRLVKALSELGVCKIKLTGGEPNVRKEYFDILKDMKQNFCKISYLNPASAHSDCIFHVF